MSAWYCNYGNGTNTGYYAVAQWAALHVYAAGDIVRQLATPAVGSERCFRTAAGGTSGAAEPSWTLTKGGTTAGDGTVTWTEVSGNSTYNWSAPLARLQTATSSAFAVNGDTVYVASAHAETQSTAMTINAKGTLASPIMVVCVNAAGSVPPVSADVTTGATVTTTGANAINISSSSGIYWEGVSFVSGAGIVINETNARFQNCAFSIANSTALDLSGALQTYINCPVTFGGTAAVININQAVVWMNTPSFIGGSVPTTLFGTAFASATFDGVDFSAAGSGKTLFPATNAATTSVNLLNCALGASVTPATTPTVLGAEVNLQITDSTSPGYRQERYTYSGTLTTETTFVRSGGASDGTTPISWKIVSTANSRWERPFSSFQIARLFPDATDTKTVGQSITVTIEIENGGTTLTNADVWVEVEYLGNSSYPLSSVASSGTANIVATGTNIPTSSVTWNGGLGSAVKQYLQVSFTPQMAGYIRATVKVAKASQTLYVDPVITVT